MNVNIRVMTQQEALEEFDAELDRLEQESQYLQRKYDSGEWALDPVYGFAN